MTLLLGEREILLEAAQAAELVIVVDRDGRRPHVHHTEVMG